VGFEPTTPVFERVKTSNALVRTATGIYPVLIYFFDWLYSPCGPCSIFNFLIYSQSVGLLGRVISSSQDLSLNTGQHKHRINTFTHTKYPCPKWDSNPRSRPPSSATVTDSAHIYRLEIQTKLQRTFRPSLSLPKHGMTQRKLLTGWTLR
jgi:hypothetical protein